MSVKLAKTAGFCMGVRRAITLVLERASKNPEGKKIYSLGPLIHNNQAIEILRAKNIKVLKNLREFDNGIIAIRAHGITPQLREKIIEIGAEICDATCPHVMHAQSITKKYIDQGYSVIIIGDKGHAEVEGLLGFTKGKGFVVESVDDVNTLPELEKVCVVAQTTQSGEHFDEIVNAIKSQYKDVIVFNTICSSTSERQKETIELAKKVDAMVVVGGKHSANTKRLVELSQSTGTPTFHIETAEELKKEMLNTYEIIGITAGASTPNWVIQNVVDKIDEIQSIKQPLLLQLITKLVRYVVYSQISVGIAAAALTYTCSLLQGIKPLFNYLLISGFYVFAINILNKYFSLKQDVLNQSAKELANLSHNVFFLKFKTQLLFSSIIALLCSVLVSFKLDIVSQLLLFLAIIGGIFYNLVIFPIKKFLRFKYRKIKDIPGSKDLFMASAWVTVSTLIPFFHSQNLATGTQQHLNTSLLILSIIFSFVLVFIRSIVNDIREIESDFLVGRETIPIVIGKQNTKLLVTVLISALFGLLFIFGEKSLIPRSVSVLFIISLVLMNTLLLILKRILISRVKYDLAIDGQFVILAILIHFAKI